MTHSSQTKEDRLKWFGRCHGSKSTSQRAFHDWPESMAQFCEYTKRVCNNLIVTTPCSPTWRKPSSFAMAARWIFSTAESLVVAGNYVLMFRYVEYDRGSWSLRFRVGANLSLTRHWCLFLSPPGFVTYRLSRLL